MTKLLIDECLSEKLALMARERGYHEASHVRWIGKMGWKDWDLKRVLLDGDWVLVTRNCIDFRGSLHTPGSRGQFAGVPLHPGLVCLNGPVGMNLQLQLASFGKALDELDSSGDLTNQVLEVSCSAPGAPIEVLRYDFPKAE